MVDLCPKQVADLREELQDRYGLSIDARITRIEFENSNKVRTYFRAEDGYVPPAPPKTEEPKHEYKVVAYEKRHRNIEDEPKVIYNSTLPAAMGVYATYQRAGYAKVELWEDDKLIQRCVNA